MPHTPCRPGNTPERALIPLAGLLRPDVTAADVAREAGVTSSHLSRVLQGERPASARVRAAACRLLGQDERELFGDELDGGVR